MLAFAKSLDVLLVHLIEFVCCFEGFLQFEDSVLEHLHVDFGLPGFLFAFLDFHFVNETVFPGSGSVLMAFFLSFAHVPLVDFLFVKLNGLVLLFVNH